MNTVVPDENATLGPVILAFYECLTDPDKLDSMMDLLTSWLDEEAGETVTPQLDYHAENAWKLLGQIAAPVAAQEDADQHLDLVVLATQTDVIRAVEDKISADDLRALMDWFNTSDQTESLLLRVFEGRSTDLAILSVHGDGFALKRTGAAFHSVISAFVADRFDLTKAELVLVQELLRGGTLRDISDRLGKSWETTRSQVKTLSNKLGVATQGDILRVVNQAGTLMPRTKASGTKSRADQVRKIARPDGRTISYEVDGPKTGKTLVFLHGLIEGRHWPEKSRRMAVQRGWQIIRISRAGRGFSSLNPKEGKALLQDHIDDVLAVVDNECIERFSLYAGADGFPIGYGLGLQNPGRLQMIVGLEVTPPILNHRAISGFSGKMKTYGLACLYAPRTIGYMLSLAMKKLQRMPKIEDRYSCVHPLLGVQLDQIEDPDGIRAIEANFQDIMEHNADGLWRDTTISGLDWAYAPDNTNTRPRAALIHCHNSMMHTSDFLNDFASRIGAPIHRIDTYLPHVSAPLPFVLDMLEDP